MFSKRQINRPLVSAFLRNQVSYKLSTIFIFSLVAAIFSPQSRAQDVFPGYAFYSSGNACYLYNMDKTLVHTWTGKFPCAGASRLLRDSSVMFVGRNPTGWSGGVLQSGRFQIIKWDGTLAWDFQYSSATYCPHHNIEVIYKTDDPKEKPNLLLAVYEKVSGTSMILDKVTEIKPTGATTGDIVWEWHAWDHRTSSPNDKPELLTESSGGGMGEWTHLNSVSYNRDLDQIVCGIKSFKEFIIIDHSTTTAEAAGSTGGKYGKGGDILYRWGKASNYGIAGSDYLSGFHSARWVPNILLGTNLTVPGAGNVVLFHNDKKELLEVKPPGNGDGIYPRNSGQAYGPSQPLWVKSLTAMGGNEGSIQKLPNGNYFISDNRSSIFEMNPSGTTVWSLAKVAMQAFKYPLTYFNDVSPVHENTISVQKVSVPKIYSNPSSVSINIGFSNSNNNAEVTICTINGKKLFHGAVYRDNLIWNTKNNSTGVYIITVRTGEKIFNSRVNLMK